MLDPKFFDDLANRLNDALPQGVRDLEADMQKKFHTILKSTFTRLDLVTREEFDTQTKVLARTRRNLTAMEKRVADLEKQLAQPKKGNRKHDPSGKNKDPG